MNTSFPNPVCGTAREQVSCLFLLKSNSAHLPYIHVLLRLYHRFLRKAQNALSTALDSGYMCVSQIYRRGSERSVDLSWEALKREVTLAVENEVTLVHNSCTCQI